MSAEARVAYDCEKGELYFSSTHRHSYGHNVKVVSAAVILFHSTCTGEPGTAKLRQDEEDAYSQSCSSVEGTQYPAGTTDGLETIPVSFSLLPVPGPGHKQGQMCRRLSGKSCPGSIAGPSVGVSALAAPPVPTVFDALADVVQQADELEKTRTAPGCHGDWQRLASPATSEKCSVQAGARQQLPPAEQERAASAGTVSSNPGCHPYPGMEPGHSQQWPHYPGQDQELPDGVYQAGDAGLMQPSHSGVADSRTLDGCEDSSPFKTEPLSPRPEHLPYCLQQGDLGSQSLESYTETAQSLESYTETAAATNDQLNPDEEKHNISARLELSDNTETHQTLSPITDASLAATVVSSVPYLHSLTDALSEGSEMGGGTESNVIDLTNIKEEPRSDDDDLQELFVSFPSETQATDSGSKSTATITKSSGIMPNNLQVYSARERTVPRPVAASVPGSSLPGSGRPLSRPLSRILGRPPSRLPHRLGSWRSHMQPLQQALKVARRIPTFSTRKGRLPARVGKSSVCGICSGEIASYQDFVHHMRLHNKGELGHTCPVCLKTFKNRTQITNRHSAIHGLRDLYTCPICSIQITRRDSFKRHFTLTHPNDSHVLNRYLQNYLTARKSGLPPSRVNCSSEVLGTTLPSSLPESSAASTTVDMTSMQPRQGSGSHWSSSAPAPTQPSESSASLSSSAQSLQRRLVLGVPYNASTVTSSEQEFPGCGVICSYCGQSLQNLSQLLHHGDIHGPQAGTSSQASYSAPYTCPLCRQMVESLHLLEVHIADRHNLPPHPGSRTVPRTSTLTSGTSSGGCSGQGGSDRRVEASEGSSQFLAPDLNYLGLGRLVQRGAAGGSGQSQDVRVKDDHRQEVVPQPTPSSSMPVFAKPLPPSSVPSVSMPPLPRLQHRPLAQTAPRVAGTPALPSQQPGCQYRGGSLQAPGLGHAALSAPSKRSVHQASFQSSSAMATTSAASLPGSSYTASVALPDRTPGSLGPPTEAGPHGASQGTPARQRPESQCQFCGMVLTSTEEFMLHVELHGCLAPRIICPICRQVFCRKAILVRHSTSHMTGKWVCKFCKKSFARRDSCKRHLHTRHGQLAGSMSMSAM